MLGVTIAFFALIGVSLSVDIVCDKDFIGKGCGSDNDCPRCLKCCEGTGKCHERTPYTGDYVVPYDDNGADIDGYSAQESEAYCMGRYGTFLPTIITDDDENRFIAVMKADVQGTTWIGSYIGLTDRDEEGVFEWTDGTPCKVKTDLCVDFWAPNQPNGGERENCVGYFWARNLEELSTDEGCALPHIITCNAPSDHTDNGHAAGMTAMNASPAKTVHILASDTFKVSSKTTHKNNKDVLNYNAYYDLMIGGLALFILINNVFICYWCVCKDNHKKVGFNKE